MEEKVGVWLGTGEGSEAEAEDLMKTAGVSVHVLPANCHVPRSSRHLSVYLPAPCHVVVVGSIDAGSAALVD
jgi:hypothetical protein